MLPRPWIDPCIELNNMMLQIEEFRYLKIRVGWGVGTGVALRYASKHTNKIR